MVANVSRGVIATAAEQYPVRVIEVTASRSEIVFEALPTDDPQVRRPDITLAREILGWEPQVGLEEGLRRVLEANERESLSV